MADIFTKAKRSDEMSRIRSRGNKATELALMRIFRACGIMGWRRQIQLRIAPEELRAGRGAGKGRASKISMRDFKVRPDFVFSQRRIAVFVDGCFWHACPLHATKPKSNGAFWRKKLAANRARDRLVTRALRWADWRVLRIWEHELARKRQARLWVRLRRHFGN